ncbi:SPASM domain-containing protein [Pseudohongiella sp. SYSU M77423]|uniref:SPASM domain-containing protein n=1 Tax=Pseudohongiella sp. SYSU M77423 TaxID=3042312 RepID=UPI0024814A0B|nr:SPASM domain-containing protein [Pseudohongiella sp. SYSU M77423]MDH7943595.1 SPASM domain-containing protein [Pseudohongiella sp. SYSU M77423]MEC8859135.1 SPASM domain-containing protein [Pseudomonadota bacterium]|tara:strand:+ start:483 stop:1568 length:1086 start_codon:yes stop_codon:yes gene_type:complete
MESIYYVLCWHCHRRCKHCYEERFRPYVREELDEVVNEALRSAPAIISNFPETMQYLDRDTPDDSTPSGFKLRTGRIIISGGDVLTDPVRERVLYPALEAIRDKYRNNGGVKVIVQTTGDLLTEKILDELLSRGVWSVSAAGIDDYHVGMQGDKKLELAAKLREMFESAGMISVAEHDKRRDLDGQGPPVYSMFGATDDAWIGKIWPRGRAWQNSLSKATIKDNFCNAWSGGLGFLEYGYNGSEVSIDPDGNVFPCCLKTARALGNLTEEPLTDILDSLAGHPVFEAINAGKPERMGLTQGQSVSEYLANCYTHTPDGRDYSNLCIGCDAFFRDHLETVLHDLRRQRLGRRLQMIPTHQTS